MLTCTRCGRHMEHIESTINNSPYCHPDAGPDCYRITSLEYALSFSSVPQRFMAGMPPMIPMHDTPIYAEMMAERETVTVEIHADATKFMAALKPLLKNRKTRR